MCGITGIISEENQDTLETYINDFKNSINHRGPDEFGYTVTNGCMILNTRLSILDLEHGSQPFYSEDKHIVVIQNGEIYNFIEVKKELQKKGIPFKTNSDTEVILKAYEYYGVNFIHHLNGMFAICILDKHTKKLYLFRDRIGVKPLYYYHNNKTILFSSEIKTFLNYPNFRVELNYQALHNYFIFNYIPVPETLFKNVFHVKPGHYLSIELESKTISSNQYWKIKDEKESKHFNEEMFIEKCDEILQNAVEIRLRSDVPIAAFLSGGLDSSLVCAIAKQKLQKPFNCFSIGFNDKRFDESPYFNKVVNLFNLNGISKIVDEKNINLWKKTTYHNDQPHGDISFIPTYILSELASQKHKLVLTGDGGDELFAGYTKYFSLLNNDVFSEKYFQSISLFSSNNLKNLYTKSLLNKIDLNQPKSFFESTINQVSQKDSINKALYFDTMQLLPGNNLVKPDKMAMAHSLETRSPFLDYRLFELAFQLPGNLKLQKNETKYIQKKLAKKYLPDDIIYRKKQMFTVPVGEWFKTDLQPYLKSMLLSNKAKERNLFDIAKVSAMIDDHICDKKNYTRELRALLNLEIWFQEFLNE
tara:strand:+ start:2632 stop:4395 length:1764 start_codon:yes stop_codon:yes gene_type:complete